MAAHFGLSVVLAHVEWGPLAPLRDLYSELSLLQRWDMFTGLDGYQRRYGVKTGDGAPVWLGLDPDSPEVRALPLSRGTYRKRLFHEVGYTELDPPPALTSRLAHYYQSLVERHCPSAPKGSRLELGIQRTPLRNPLLERHYPMREKAWFPVYVQTCG